MSNLNTFSPNWVSAPGDTIRDVLKDRRLSVADLARMLECTEGDAHALLRGRTRINIGLARRLVSALGSSVEFWMSREFRYREELIRLQATEEEWLQSLPVRDMVKFGWIAPADNRAGEVDACLSFFGVRDVVAWRQAYSSLHDIAVFRTSPSFESRPAAVAAWLRQGEIQAQLIDCERWNLERFRRSVGKIRTLTRQKDPSKFMPVVQKICSECGVAVVIVRAPSGCRASGATRFLTPDKALLLLSFRHLSDDHFWFTFFHEAGHLILHGVEGFFIEVIGGPKSEKEREANEFAGNVLVPAEYRPELLALPLNSREVIRFARQIGVSPGIVVGQLQHFRRIEQYHLNRLKRRYTW